MNGPRIILVKKSADGRSYLMIPEMLGKTSHACVSTHRSRAPVLRDEVGSMKDRRKVSDLALRVFLVAFEPL